MTGNPTRRGLAPVEVLVIAAVAAVALALAVPALRASQIFSRRVRCENNLKQIGIACHNYHDVFGALPNSRIDGPGHGTGQGCFLEILPFMEQAAAFNGYNFA